MGFAKDSKDFVACMKFLEKNQTKGEGKRQYQRHYCGAPFGEPVKTKEQSVTTIEDKIQEEANDTEEYEKVDEEEEASTALTRDKNRSNTTKITEAEEKKQRRLQQVPKRLQSSGPTWT